MKYTIPLSSVRNIYVLYIRKWARTSGGTVRSKAKAKGRFSYKTCRTSNTDIARKTIQSIQSTNQKCVGKISVRKVGMLEKWKKLNCQGGQWAKGHVDDVG